MHETIETQQFAFRDGERDVLLTAEVPVYTCHECGEQFLGENGEIAQHETVCHYLGRMSPREIRALRKSLGMTQQTLAEATGIGVASIKRWEAGKLIQSAAMDHTLRALKHGTTSSRQKPFAPIFRTEIQKRSMESSKLFELRPSA
jgi:putative zinc finger/helix-turn-helix YgiT family protein